MSRICFRLIVDENVPSSVSEYLRQRRHSVTLAQDVFTRGTADFVIAIAADEQGAIVVTINCKHFERLVSKRDNRGNLRFPNMGLIALDCETSVMVTRLSEFIDLIEAEYALAQARQDKRLLVMVRNKNFRVLR